MQCLGRLSWWPDVGGGKLEAGQPARGALWEAVLRERRKAPPLGTHLGCYVTLQGVSVTVHKTFLAGIEEQGSATAFPTE